MIRGNICFNCSPAGCAAFVRAWKERAKAEAASLVSAAAVAGARPAPKTVLLLGGSMGYGLASRAVSSYCYGATTVSVSFERSPDEKRQDTPGWHTTIAFDREADTDGIRAYSLNADAFSDATRDAVIALAREKGLSFDLVVYSLASPVRVDPKTGVMYRSALKPLGAPYQGLNVDVWNGSLSQASIEPANEAEAADTVKVMGGEDWKLWIDALSSAKLLSRGALTVAYSYIGPERTWPLYRSGTLGKAKEHLERTAKELTSSLRPIGGAAYVSVNKALVTRASAVIPTIPLYVSALYKVMKEKGVHEDCLDQILRLFRERLYGPKVVPVDEAGRVRIDDLELREDVQSETARVLGAVNSENVASLVDLEGFRRDFLQAHGFAMPGVDYAD